MADAMREVRVFVSSPGDARFERSRLERVTERLNGEFQGIVRIVPIRWETEFYKAHQTFQAQIPEAAQCEIVVAIFRGRLGSVLPADFPRMTDGEPYPSGTAYEVLTAIDASKAHGFPDVYVFRFPQPPSVQLDDPKRNEIETQWQHLKAFFDTWFKTPQGEFKAAFHSFASTDDFEAQVEVLLRKWLEEKVLHGRSFTWPAELKGSPFRGLAAFGAKHAPVFFGRSRDITKAVDRLKDAAEKGCPFLLVDGASGAGKSSLVRAGLVPRLTAAGVVPSVDLWRVAVMRPAEVLGDPFATLAHALFVAEADLPEAEQGRPPALPELSASDFARADDLAALLTHADASALKPILSTFTGIEQTVREKEGYDRTVKAALLLVVDQLDELFGANIGNDIRARFARLLGLLARSGRVWMIATLRADLFDHFLAQRDLKQLKDDGSSYDLAPPDAAALAEIVRAPAAAAGLVYESDAETGERLDERLLRDAERADLLPLLQFTLNQLFEARERPDHNRLTFAAYRALGGLEGAVEKEAEAAFARLGATEQARLPRLLRELVAPAGDGTMAAARAAFDIRPVPLTEAAYDEASAKLVQALVDARILLSAGEGGQATVRLAHARVLDSWQRASRIVADNTDFYRVRAEVEEQRRRWEAAGRRRDLLIGRGRPLAEAESIVRRFSGELPTATREFVQRSGRRARLMQTLTAAAAVIFAAVAVAAVVQWQHAVSARREAEDKRDQLLILQSRFLVDLANQLIREWDAGTAMLLALEALPDMRSGIERPLVQEAEATLFNAYQELQERIILKGHKSSLWSASFTPDGRRVVTVSEDNTARVWDAENGGQLATLQGHTGPVRVAAFSPNGWQLITASTDKTARLWNVETGKQSAVLEHGEVVRSAAFSPDGRRIVTASGDKTARIWDAQKGTQIVVLTGHDAPVWMAVFSPSGRYILTTSEDTTVRLWDAETGEVVHTLEGHTQSVRGAAFSPSGESAITTSLDHTARLWNVETGKQSAVLEHGGAVWSAAFSPDGRRIVTASDDNTARVWDAPTGRQLAVLTGHTAPVRSAVFSPDGGSIVTASDDDTARIWNADSGKLAMVLKGHLSQVRSAVFSSDGRYVLTASDDTTARLWSAKAETRMQMAVLTGHVGPVRSAVFSADGRRALTASDDNSIRLWDAELGQQIAVFTTHSAGPGAAAFSPDGRLVAMPDDNTVVVRDADTANSEYRVLQGHSAPVWSAAFSPDGRRIVTASDDKTIRIWDAQTAEQIVVLKGHTAPVRSAAFSPDGLRVVSTQMAQRTGNVTSDNNTFTSDDSIALLWDALSGEVIRRFEGHMAQVYNATFSPDGKRIVTASADNTARIWDAARGTTIVVLKGHSDSVFSAAFSPQGDRIVTASADKTARVWDAEAGKTIAVLEGHSGPVSSAMFGPDGERVLTASDDTTARIWRVFPTAQALVDRSKMLVPRCLTPEQLVNAFLDPQPPAWCFELKKWPYQTVD